MIWNPVAGRWRKACALAFAFLLFLLGLLGAAGSGGHAA